jgi:hypothetical protein
LQMAAAMAAAAAAAAELAAARAEAAEAATEAQLEPLSESATRRPDVLNVAVTLLPDTPRVREVELLARHVWGFYLPPTPYPLPPTCSTWP